mgnify:CR=1 FL=1
MSPPTLQRPAECRHSQFTNSHGSNSLEVAKGVREKMEQLAANLPEGVVYDVTLDTTQ